MSDNHDDHGHDEHDDDHDHDAVAVTRVTPNDTRVTL